MKEFLFPKKISAAEGVEKEEYLLIKKELQIGLAEKK